MALVQLRDGPVAVERTGALTALADWRRCIRMPELLPEAPDPSAVWRRWLTLVSSVVVFTVSHDRRMDALPGIAETLRREIGQPLPLEHDHD